MDAFNPSSLPKKVVLSGADCFHLVLDKHARKHRSGDNVMRIVFYFDENIEAGSIEAILNRSPLVHWLCNITMHTGFFLSSPYWKYKDEGRPIPFKEHTHPATYELPEELLNRDIPINATCFIECDIVRYPSGASVLVFSWNHILMDGRGIGMFVNHLNELGSNDGRSWNGLFPAAEKKAGVFSHIRNMYAVKRFIKHSSRSPISSVYRGQSNSSPHFKNRIIYFTKEETAVIEKQAFDHGARFGANLYYLSCCAHTVNQVNINRKNGGVIWMPIPYDGRLKGSTGPVISNFVSYLFYRLAPEEMTDLRSTVQSMNKQMAAQLKEEMPRKYGMLLKMMRHFPLGLYYFLVNRTGEGSFSSFLYSSTGNNFNAVTSLFGNKVTNLTIYPSSTFPPGLTFSFLKHGDALNVNIAYSSDILSNIEVDFIEKNIQNLLLSIRS